MEEYKLYKKDFSRLGFRFVIGTIAIYAVQILAQIVVSMIWPGWEDNMNAVLVVGMIPMYLVGIPILIVLVRGISGSAPEKHKMGFGKFLLSLIMCFSIMYCSNLVGTIIMFIIGLLKGSAVNQNAVTTLATSANMGLTFFFMVLCAPVIEEYVFRKLIVDRTRRYGEGVAVIISGLMFGLFHGNLSQFVYAFTLGMFLAFLYVKTGNLKITIGVHMVVNFMGGIASVLILKMLESSGLYEIAENTDYLQIMEFINAMSPEDSAKFVLAMLVFFVYLVFVLCIVITGIVLLIVFRKKFTLSRGEVVLEKGRRFKTMFLNPGMICYIVFWIAMIVWQIFFG